MFTLTRTQVKLFRWINWLSGNSENIYLPQSKNLRIKLSEKYLFFSDCSFQTYGNQSITSPFDNEGSMISVRAHDQSKSYLCWVYSFATSNKSSLKKFIYELKLPKRQTERCLSKLDSEDFHKTLRQEACMIIPTDYKNEGVHQALKVRVMMVRVSSHGL